MSNSRANDWTRVRLERFPNSVPRLNFSDPTILNLDNTTFNQEYAVIPENYTDGYVYLIVTAQNLTNPPDKIVVPLAHPIHLHGHDFVILAQSTDPYNVNTSINTFNFNNPPRRDVALLPSGGYLAIAFRPDNPGVWLLHCHIGKILLRTTTLIQVHTPNILFFTAWHASSGLALQIMERQSDIASSIGSLDGTRDTCLSWDTWFAENNDTFGGPGNLQDDSGI